MSEKFLTLIEKNFPHLIVRESERYKRDWTPLLVLREILGEDLGKPVAVLSPSKIEELVEIVKLANENNVCIVPYGGGSSVVGGSYHNGCLIIDMSKLNRIIEFNDTDLTVTVEAGIKISDLEHWLNNRGYTLDYHPQSFYLATIGGAIAHKGSGSHSQSNIENLVLWMEVLFPSGDLIYLGFGKAIRTSMIPDLIRLFIGSEGTLGIITKVKLRVFPLAPFHTDLAFAFDNFNKSIKFARDFAIRLPPPHRIVIHDKDSSMFMLNLPYNIALIRIRGYDEELVNAQERVTRKIAQNYNSKEIERDLVKVWRDVFARKYEEQLTKLISSGLWNDTLDLAGSWSVLSEIYDKLKSELLSIEGVNNVLSRITHLYTNGASLYNVVIMKQDIRVLEKVWETTAKIVINSGGTISHHHGVGLLKRKWVKDEATKQLELLKNFKKLLDGKNLLNPGKLI
ncbi:FAD-binding oxidoreductase [Saccharolobus caldissimus]|uniref:Alkyldihydroxyacetonephosphate synthase n=1 Tax=Saccharolobus caldissimus TaxID=1702097 RepID=A0AAQ4CV64_9CREN|nr:FAD-binding oxidoreductase [Saccharolobus caldissimus]BDB99695.1 alkyldihydroxyacetonephosphate synthase [Saccharolobus caldissimus]